MIEVFAKHMTADAKKLEEDEETGAQSYRYIKTGENHFSFAFTYAWLATFDDSGFQAWRRYFRIEKKRQLLEEEKATRYPRTRHRLS